MTKPEKLVCAMDISELELPNKVKRILVGHGIETIGDLMQYSYDDLLSLSHIGEATCQKISDAVDEYGMYYEYGERLTFR